jgi:hypothetical protein
MPRHHGPNRVSDVTLERGITSDVAIREWRQQIVDGDFAGAEADLTIPLRSRPGGPIAVWHSPGAGLLLAGEGIGEVDEREVARVRRE